MSHELLDARRLLCPIPVIRVQDRVETLVPGTLLEVVATDPGVVNDIPAWCRLNGHEVKEIREQAGEITLLIKVGSQ